MSVPIYVVDAGKPLNQLHSDLCVRLRQIDRIEELSQSKCVRCGRLKANHCPDERCSIDALSRHFYSEHFQEHEKIKRALELIEELKVM